MSKDEVRISKESRSKDIIKANYDRLSRWYDLLAGWSERKAVECGLKQLDLRSGETVLEIGYGTGRSIVALGHAVGPSGCVLGIDISDGMHRIAAARVQKANLSDRVTLIRGDATFLAAELQKHAALSPAPNDLTVLPDAIFMSFTLELLNAPEITSLLRECRRILRVGGRIVVVAMHDKPKRNAMSRLYEWAHRRIPELVDCRPIHADQALADAGFRVTQKLEMSVCGVPIMVVVAMNSGDGEGT